MHWDRAHSSLNLIDPIPAIIRATGLWLFWTLGSDPSESDSMFYKTMQSLLAGDNDWCLPHSNTFRWNASGIATYRRPLWKRTIIVYQFYVLQVQAKHTQLQKLAELKIEITNKTPSGSRYVILVSMWTKRFPFNESEWANYLLIWKDLLHTKKIPADDSSDDDLLRIVEL